MYSHSEMPSLAAYAVGSDHWYSRRRRTFGDDTDGSLAPVYEGVRRNTRGASRNVVGRGARNADLYEYI